MAYGGCCGGGAIVGGCGMPMGGMYQMHPMHQLHPMHPMHPMHQMNQMNRMQQMHMGQGAVVGFGQQQGHAQFGGGRMQGVLSEWNDEKACGFIECVDGGKKLFAHKSDFAMPFEDGLGPAIGAPLNFSLGSDPKSGKQRARDIRLGGLGMGGGGGAAADGPRLFGSLSEWNPSKACGFIQCTNPPGKKLFAHKSEFAVQFGDGEDPPVGTTMSFVHGFDSKSGRERAQDIKLEDGESLRLYGHLCEWRDEKACGFIEVVDDNGNAGKKYFAHKSEFAEPFTDTSAPTVGTEMSFLPGRDQKSGRERATDIRMETGGIKRSTIGVIPQESMRKRMKI